MWWCPDQTATATRTSRPIHRRARARTPDTCFPWLPISAVDKTNLYPTPGSRQKHRGPFFGFGFSHFPPGARAGDDTTTNGLPLSISFSLQLTTRHHHPPIGLPLHARLFFNQPFPRTAQQRRGRGGCSEEGERTSLPFGTRTCKSFAPDAHTHTRQNVVSCIQHHACATRTSIIQPPTSSRSPMPRRHFSTVLISGKHLFFTHHGVGYKPSWGPGMTA